MVSENNFLNDDRLGFAAEQYAMLRAGGKGVSVDFNGGQLLTEREYSRVIKKAVDSLTSEAR